MSAADMAPTMKEAQRIAREKLNSKANQIFDRGLFFALDGYPFTTEEMALSLIRSDRYHKQRHAWLLANEKKYGIGQGGFLNYEDPFVPMP